MLVNLYKTKTPVAIFSFPLLIGLLGLPLFFNENNTTISFFQWQAEASDFILRTPVYNYLTTILIVYFSALRINRLMNVYGFFSRNTYLPGLIYSFTLFGFDQFKFSVHIIAYALLILGLDYLLRINRQEPAKSAIFMSAFLFGTATILEPFLAPLLILPWFTLLIFKSFVWREWALLFFGISLPWLYHYMIHFAFTGSFNIPLENISMPDFHLQLSVEKTIYTAFLVIVILFLTWSFLVLLKNQLLLFKQRSRLLFSFIWLTLISLIAGLLLSEFLIIALFIPFSIIGAIHILNAKKDLFANVVFALWIGLIVWNLFL